MRINATSSCYCIPGKEDHCTQEDYPWEICFPWHPKAPAPLAISTGETSILIHKSLFCLTKPMSGCVSLETSQAGHIASNYGDKSIKTTLLCLGGGQHPLERKVAGDRLNIWTRAARCFGIPFPSLHSPTHPGTRLFPALATDTLLCISWSAPWSWCASKTLQPYVLEIQNFRPEMSLDKGA